MGIDPFTAIVGSAIIGGVSSARAAKKSARAQQAGYDAATAEQQRQFDVTRRDLAPYTALGGRALEDLQDPNAFYTSPGYDFRRSEGQRDLGNMFSARGTGGNAMRALTEFNQNLASNEFANWYNRRAQEASMGLGAATRTGQFGAQKAANVSNALIGAGQAQAQGYMDRYSGINNAIQSGIGNMLYAQERGLLKPGQTPGVVPDPSQLDADPNYRRMGF